MVCKLILLKTSVLHVKTTLCVVQLYAFMFVQIMIVIKEWELIELLGNKYDITGFVCSVC